MGTEDYQGEVPATDGIKGWRLSVTLNPRTPLAWLERDGEYLHGAARGELPHVPSAHAYWAPVAKSISEIHAELGLPPPSITFKVSSNDRASFVGPVARDGGDVLPFLKAYRSIIEGPGSTFDRCFAVKLYCEKPENVRIGLALKPSFAMDWAIDAIDDALPIGREIAERIFSAELHDLDAIRAASNEKLKSIPGMGPKRIAAIRAALGQ